MQKEEPTDNEFPLSNHNIKRGNEMTVSIYKNPFVFEKRGQAFSDYIGLCIHHYRNEKGVNTSKHHINPKFLTDGVYIKDRWNWVHLEHEVHREAHRLLHLVLPEIQGSFNSYNFLKSELSPNEISRKWHEEVGFSDEIIQKISLSGIGRPYAKTKKSEVPVKDNPEKTKWFHNPITGEATLSKTQPEGFIRGRSEKDAAKARVANKGNTHSPEHVEYMRQISSKARWYHCPETGLTTFTSTQPEGYKPGRY